MPSPSPYEAEVTDLLNTLKAAGFTLVDVDNGDDYVPVHNDVKRAADEILAVDDSRLKVKTSTGIPGILWIVLGNHPGELVADYTLTDGLDDLVTRFYQKWEKVTFQRRG